MVKPILKHYSTYPPICYITFPLTIYHIFSAISSPSLFDPRLLCMADGEEGFSKCLLVET